MDSISGPDHDTVVAIQLEKPDIIFLVFCSSEGMVPPKSLPYFVAAILVTHRQ